MKEGISSHQKKGTNLREYKDNGFNQILAYINAEKQS